MVETIVIKVALKKNKRNLKVISEEGIYQN